MRFRPVTLALMATFAVGSVSMPTFVVARDSRCPQIKKSGQTLIWSAAAGKCIGDRAQATAATVAGPPYKLDAKGKCHAANGKVVKTALCAKPSVADHSTLTTTKVD